MQRAFAGAAALQAMRSIVAWLMVVGFADVGRAQFHDYFSIVETGSGASTSVEVRFEFRSIFGNGTKLTSPSGEVFTPAHGSIFDRSLGSLLKTFSSLEDAFSFLSGDWQGVYTTGFINRTEVSYVFQIAPLTPDSVYRGGLENLSLRSGDHLRSGQTFLLSWDFPDGSSPGAYLSIVPQFSSGSSLSTRFFSRPSPNQNTHSSGGSSGSSGSFHHDYKNEPRTSEFRFLTTYSGAPLPLDLMMTFGATTSLNSAVQNAAGPPTSPLQGPPQIGLRYIRLADPIEVTLVSIPEPGSTSLVAIAAACAAICSRNANRLRSIGRRAAD